MPDEPKALSRAQILAADDRRIEPVKVPEWGGEIHVRAMTGRERGAFDEHLSELNFNDYRALLVVACACDAEGKRLFGDDDVEQLTLKGAGALTRISDAAARLNGLREQDVEAIEGNSQSAPNDEAGSI